MDEKRIQAYLQIIQTLINSPDGTEMEVLANHSDLVDTGLIQIMEVVAARSLKDGNHDIADWLQELAQKLQQTLIQTAASQDNQDNRQQGYLELIEALLQCPNGEETEILDANRNLLDAGLVQTMNQVASDLEKRGANNQATFLINIARELESILDNHDNYSEFWQQVLEKIVITQGNQKEVYELLANNQDLLNQEFSPWLNEWTREKFSQLSSSKQEDLAKLIYIFGNLILKFPLDNPQENKEIALNSYQLALTVFNQENYPEYWAASQHALGNVYSVRIEGEKSENIENAINCYENALTQWIQVSIPLQWAMTKYALGNAYRERILGDKGENIDTAINCYKLTLGIWTKDIVPLDWAMTKHALGVAYSERILGNKGENMETAINCLENALSIYTKDKEPLKWAVTKYALGNAYKQRVLGDKRKNIATAINCLENALAKYTPQLFPSECLKIALDLGNLAFTEGNSNLAIWAYAQAIEVIELSRSQIADDQHERLQELTDKTISVYQNIIQCYINTNQLEKALEYAERSRSQRLIDLIGSFLAGEQRSS